VHRLPKTASNACGELSNLPSQPENTRERSQHDQRSDYDRSHTDVEVSRTSTVTAKNDDTQLHAQLVALAARTGIAEASFPDVSPFDV
jgi:hypothetical protein